MPALHYVTPSRPGSPLRSIPTFRAVHVVLGYTPEQQAEMARAAELASARFTLENAEALVAYSRKNYVADRRAIGDANRGIVRGIHYPRASKAQRREFRSRVFRAFNASLRLLRQAEAKLVVAQVALAVLVGA